jgi:predicted nucleotidyltransferase
MMPNGSSSSVTIVCLGGPETIRALREIATGIKQANPDVLQISLSGSLARGDYALGSDADLFILVQEDGQKPFDRIPLFLRLFLDSPIDSDVLVYTMDEIEKKRLERNLLLAQIEREKIRLA